MVSDGTFPNYVDVKECQNFLEHLRTMSVLLTAWQRAHQVGRLFVAATEPLLAPVPEPLGSLGSLGSLGRFRDSDVQQFKLINPWFRCSGGAYLILPQTTSKYIVKIILVVNKCSHAWGPFLAFVADFWVPLCLTGLCGDLRASGPAEALCHIASKR